MAETNSPGLVIHNPAGANTSSTPSETMMPPVAGTPPSASDNTSVIENSPGQTIRSSATGETLFAPNPGFEEVTVQPQPQQLQQPSDSGGGGAYILWIMLAMMLVFIWFSGRSQKKKEQERKDKLASLKKGDKVVTIGLMHGTVVALTEETVTLKTDEKGNMIVFERNAVYKIMPRAGENVDLEKDKDK